MIDREELKTILEEIILDKKELAMTRIEAIREYNSMLSQETILRLAK